MVFFFLFVGPVIYLRDRTKLTNAMIQSRPRTQPNRNSTLNPKGRQGLCCTLGRHQEGALTCDQTGDDEREDEHLQHPHEDVSRESYQHDHIRVDGRRQAKQPATYCPQDDTCPRRERGNLNSVFALVKWIAPRSPITDYHLSLVSA